MTALTRLSEDERLFFETVRDFAKQRIGPRVSAMDEAGALDESLLPALFELGVMGIEIPEQYGGAGSSFFNAILAVEALACIDPSVSVLVDVQNTLVVNALLRWASEQQKQRTSPPTWSSSWSMPTTSTTATSAAARRWFRPVKRRRSRR